MTCFKYEVRPQNGPLLRTCGWNTF